MQLIFTGLLTLIMAIVSVSILDILANIVCCLKPVDIPHKPATSGQRFLWYIKVILFMWVGIFWNKFTYLIQKYLPHPIPCALINAGLSLFIMKFTGSSVYAGAANLTSSVLVGVIGPFQIKRIFAKKGLIV